MNNPPLRDNFFLPPDDVIRVWEERGELLHTVAWSEMINEGHAGGFTVAKVAKLDLLRIIRASLDDVIRGGGTFEEWQRDLVPQLKKHGWWSVVTDPSITGTSDTVVINKRRIENIYRTNVRMSMAAGEWRKIQAKKHLLPYLRYRSDHFRKHPRLNHQSWHGLILSVDDPAWQWLYPPNGWGCNCLVDQIGDDQLRMNKWTVGAAPKPPLNNFTTATGEIIQVPEGIAPGFGYNPGTAHLQVIAERAMAATVKAVEHGLLDEAELIIRSIVNDAAFAQFMHLPTGQFPVALLTKAQQQLIDAPSQIILLPPRIMLKQRGLLPEISPGHPDLTLDDYRVLPDLISRSIAIAKEGDFKLHFFRDASGKIWKAVVRYDAGLPYPAVVSFHKSNPKAMRQQLAKLEIIQDNR